MASSSIALRPSAPGSVPATADRSTSPLVKDRKLLPSKLPTSGIQNSSTASSRRRTSTPLAKASSSCGLVRIAAWLSPLM